MYVCSSSSSTPVSLIFLHGEPICKPMSYHSRWDSSKNLTLCWRVSWMCSHIHFWLWLHTQHPTKVQMRFKNTRSQEISGAPGPPFWPWDQGKHATTTTIHTHKYNWIWNIRYFLFRVKISELLLLFLAMGSSFSILSGGPWESTLALIKGKLIFF